MCLPARIDSVEKHVTGRGNKVRYRIADGLADDGAARTWSDSLGRSVAVPGEIRRVAPYGPYAQALMESIDPGMVVQVTARGLHASVAQGAAALDEDAPDVILDVAVREGWLRTAVNTQADDFGVPIVHLVVAPGELPAAYRALGKLLGRQDRCDELADYVAAIDVTLAQVREQVPEAERKRVYVGRGFGACWPCRGTSLAAAVVAAAGGRFVGADEKPADVIGFLRESKVDLAILAPDVFEDKQAYETFAEFWSWISADIDVLHAIAPNYPEPWFGRSPLLMQTIGSLWLVDTLHPGCLGQSIEAVIDEFFILFFNQKVEDLEEGYYINGENGSKEAAAESGEYVSPSVESIAQPALSSINPNVSSDAAAGCEVTEEGRMYVYDSSCHSLYYDPPRYNRNSYSVAIFTLELIADLDTGRLMCARGYFPLVRARRAGVEVPEAAPMPEGALVLGGEELRAAAKLGLAYRYEDCYPGNGGWFTDDNLVLDERRGVIRYGAETGGEHLRVNDNLVVTVLGDEITCLYMMPDRFI